MTREEREKAIVKLSEIYTGDYRLAEALKLAIESLKSEPRYLYDADTGKYKELTSGDCIDRKHLLNEISDLMESPWFNRGKDDLGSALHYGYVERKEAVEIVRDLCVKAEPSVTPERPSVNDICKILSDALGSPCNYGLDGEEVADIIPSEWCEDNCPTNENYSICWKKYFEIKYADMRE